MTAFYEGREVWFYTGSQDLYGEDVLVQVADQSREVVRLLNESGLMPAPVVWKPVLKDSDSIRRAMLEASADDKVLGVISWMHTFSPAKMWIRGLEVLSKPLLHLATQANVEIPWDTIDMDFMNLNQAAHGDREYAYILTRLGVARTTVVGHASNASTCARVADWIRAAAGFAATNELRVVRFGDNMRNVAVTEGDKTEAERRLGVSVNTWGVNDLIAVVDAVEEEAIDELVAVYEAEYEVEDALKKGGERHESLRYAAREEIALRRFLDERGAKAFTTNFEDLGTLRQLPGLAVQRLMADGYGFGAEGDWKTAVLVRAAKVMGEGLVGGASLMEDYCYNFVEGEEMILGAHMLEICPSLTASKPRIEIHPLGIGGKEDPVRMVFNADARPGVVVAMSDMRDRFRLTANVVDVVEPPRDMPKLPVARAMWQPKPDFYTSVEAWLTAGAAHHTCMSTQVGVEVWEMFAKIAKMELLVIDEQTTRRDFAASSKWNQAYYRLAEGL
ncbi:L-arabinose isomerase [Schaalia hyovaginalis]|uniref:L-arabinose isomerase n=1 Tax=Schaalia hyovaginalis TaxID=29316 RepID=UPI0026EB1928|nr:L-arabinose isomerase [Schaalia hyovaginalis]MDD7553975.1 L-arabinose isomerase [Schaalia hyovaginalis]MDY3093470.1 L-arabinose isomerase [Schaalia hyovaginalis]